MPRQHCGKDHDGVRDAITRKLGNPAKDENENDHGQKWAEHRPKNSNYGLLVTHEHVAPGEKIKELAVPEQVSPVIALGMPGFDDDFGGHEMVTS